MPAPDHLRLILHALGTGGTREMAERVYEYTAGLQRQIDGLTAQIGQLAQVLAAECEISNPMEATCAAAVVVIRAQAAEIRRLNTLLEPKRAGIRDLIEASSLGTPDAVAARESVPVELAQAAVARAAELAGDDGPTVEAARPPSNDEIRAWCQAHGVQCSPRGPISNQARRAYDNAHQEA